MRSSRPYRPEDGSHRALFYLFFLTAIHPWRSMLMDSRAAMLSR